MENKPYNFPQRHLEYMPFCSSCGKEVASYQKFCKYCGAPVEELPALPTPHPELAVVPPPPPPPKVVQAFQPPQLPAEPPPESPGSPANQPPVTPSKKLPFTKNTIMILGAVVVLVVLAGVYFVIMPKMQDIAGTGDGTSGSLTQTQQVTKSPPPTTPFSTASTVPTPTPDPFPHALALKTWFPFGGGNVVSEGTVYDYWINDTYQWHNDADAKWYTQKPKPGTKYLFIFSSLVNHGTARVWFPTSHDIFVHYNSVIYTVDTSHYLPDRTEDIKATPVEVGEIQYRHQLIGAEYVTDYGFSNGQELAYLYPGESNAVEGYLIYEVPASLSADKSFVEIAFNGKDRAVWKLA
jgi:hypothetical protein